MRPRPVLANQTSMFTRRCSERRFFLRPDRVTINTFWYCLGWAAQKHGMVLHAAVAMSNHVHVHATDPNGTYPNFLRDFFGLLARAMNSWRGRSEHFWDSNQASVVRLEDEAAQIEKLLYVLTNPVRVVGQANRWPGPSSLAATCRDGRITAFKPHHFFRDEGGGGAMPDKVTLTFEPPPACAHMNRDEFRELLRAGIAKIESEAATTRKNDGTLRMKRRHVLAQRWNDRPRDGDRTPALKPTVACRDKWLRFERLSLNRAFQDLYRSALTAFAAGLLDAIFPLGTWLMRFRAPIVVAGDT